MNLACFKLQAINPVLNVKRYYSIYVGKDLFGQWEILTSYGRIGYDGQKKSYTCNSFEETLKHIQRILRKRFAAKKRIGCNYTLYNLSMDQKIAHHNWLPLS